MTQRTPCVLVIEPDRFERDRLGLWLNDAGYEVWLCPGPGGGSHEPGTHPGCVGLAGGACALAEGADVVILDTAPADADDLRALYRGRGLPVIDLERPAERRRLLEDLYAVTGGRTETH